MQESENQRKKNRKLHDDFQAFIHDINPDIEIPSNIMRDNQIFDAKSNKYSQEIEQYDEKLKNRIVLMERELEREKRAHVNTAERAQTQQEGIQKELLSLKKLMRDEHSDCDPMSRKQINSLKQEYQENLSKLNALQLTLQNQIDNNTQTQKQMDIMQSQKVKILEQQINALQSENINLKRSNKMKMNMYHDNIDGVVVGNDINSTRIDVEKYQKQVYNLKKKYKENDMKYKNKIQELKTRISELEMSKNGDTESDKNMTWERVRKLEKEKAELTVKVHALESELVTLETHHKKELQKYKKLIVKLKNK